MIEYYDFVLTYMTMITQTEQRELGKAQPPDFTSLRQLQVQLGACAYSAVSPIGTGVRQAECCEVGLTQSPSQSSGAEALVATRRRHVDAGG